MTDTCPSCGRKYADHRGLIGTCAESVELRRQLAQCREALRKIGDMTVEQIAYNAREIRQLARDAMKGTDHDYANSAPTS